MLWVRYASFVINTAVPSRPGTPAIDARRTVKPIQTGRWETSGDIFQVAAKPPKRKPHEHLTSEEIAAFVNHQIPPAKQGPILKHLADCHDCRQLIGNVMRSRTAVEDPDSRSN